MSKALELADRLEKLTASGLWYDGKPAAEELRRLAAVEAERDALKEQMRDVAMLLLDNERSGIKAWATGLVLSESTGKWSVRTVVADQQKEIDALKAELERIRALPGGHSVDPQWVADMVRWPEQPNTGNERAEGSAR